MNRRFKIEGYEDRLKLAITASGMTKYEIAKRMGVDRKVFCHSRDAQMNSGTLARFCAVTGESADWLLGLKKERR